MYEGEMNVESHSEDDPDDDAHAMYPDDLLSRMFGMASRVPTDDDDAVESAGDDDDDDLHQTLIGRMFERASAAPPPEPNTSVAPEAGWTNAEHVLARMFHTPAMATTTTTTSVHVQPPPDDDMTQSAIPTMSILETHDGALNDLPLSSRMFDSDVPEERDKINQYEFQSVIREIVSVRHSIRDHVIQLRQLRALHRKYEETLHEMLHRVKQDGVRSCDYPLLFYMSRRTKRRVNKQVHQSEQLQTYMKSRGIHMSDVERKDLITLIKKESYIKNTEGMIRSVPIDGR